METIRIGTRGSRLALAQSDWVRARARDAMPGVEVEIVEIRTSGDAIQDVPLGPELGSSFFTKEIEDALLSGRIDLAVHSCKDLATRMPAGLTLGAVPIRVDPRDVLVSRSGPLSELPEGARIGTCSPRRKGFLRAARDDLDVRDQRGNVPTRVGAVDDGRVDAVVLAAAGLLRLGLDERITEWLDPDLMLPAAAQGALAVQTRVDDPAMAELCRSIDDVVARVAVEAERACLRRLEAGCQAPVGALGASTGNALTLAAAIVTPDEIVRTRVEADAGEEPDAVGTRAAEELLGRLGVESLTGFEWAGPPPRTLETPT